MLLPILLACHKVVEVDPPDPSQDLEPLEAVNLAPEVPADGSDLYPEDISFASGERDDGTYWAHSKANVQASLFGVWTCFQDPDAVVDRREVDEWTSEQGTEPGFDFSVLIHNTVHDIITVDFDILWVHDVVDGTVDDPAKVVINWQKNDGSSVIQLLVGSAILLPEDDGAATRLELEEDLQATQRDEQTVVSYETDLFDSIAACAHGEPLPEF